MCGRFTQFFMSTRVAGRRGHSWKFAAVANVTLLNSAHAAYRWHSMKGLPSQCPRNRDNVKVHSSCVIFVSMAGPVKTDPL
jgi:hypothetical protein